MLTVIGYYPDVIKTADYIVDVAPDASGKGRGIIAAGILEKCRNKRSLKLVGGF